MGLIRVLLVGDRTMDRIAMESRLSIDDRIVVETVGDICSAASLVEWRHYSLVVVNVFGLGRSLVHLINNFSQHSRQPWIAFWGGRSTAMVRAAEMIAEARGVGVLKGGGLGRLHWWVHGFPSVRGSSCQWNFGCARV